MRVGSLEDIPLRATVRKEFISSGKPGWKKVYGPYLYAYWKEEGELKKAYIGKSNMDLKRRSFFEQVHMETGLPISIVKKKIVIVQLAQEGNALAIEYLRKVENGGCSIPWAYRKLSEALRRESGTTRWRPTVSLTK